MTATAMTKSSDVFPQRNHYHKLNNKNNNKHNNKNNNKPISNKKQQKQKQAGAELGQAQLKLGLDLLYLLSGPTFPFTPI